MHFECFGLDAVDSSSAWVHSWGSLVVVNQFDIERICILETEDDTPICSHRDRPETFEVTCQLMQTITGKVHSEWRLGLVKSAENIIDPIQQVGPYSARVAAFIKPFQTAVLETSDHKNTL